MTDEPGAGPRILLVEDELANRALVHAIIARTDRPELLGTVLHEAVTLGEARSVLASEVIDVVLVDVRLPDGSGLDLAAELATDPVRDSPRVVIISASVLPAERTKALASGAAAFLAKPLDASHFVDLLVRLAAV